ncbi:Pur operon repressor [Oxobacter pfennigii]|uniref:Pur operon repressor n=1 Tax=Oxobacter pfennigii TaxID=36849 RepID=A0A0P9ACH8_9CLOT|nr:pur operon repressor [Oxobacter pfennigii]KPU42803.1 Pur operon repressor [Oxobacter pfennigii]
MDKLHRNERIGALIKILSDNPNKIFTLNYFTDLFNAAKSTISEDIVIVKKIMEKFSFGEVETISGAAGGVKYTPVSSMNNAKKFVKELCTKLMSPERIIPGGFIYMTDVIYSPDTVAVIGEILATQFVSLEPDYVLTVETKGIPVALMTARALNIPLLIVRRDSKVTEGSTVSINYVSGSTRRIQTMSLSKRSIKKNTKSIFIDDFMKAGGTAHGIIELMKEFENEVVGIGVLIETKEPRHKLVNSYVSLLTLDEVDEEKGKINIQPSRLFI